MTKTVLITGASSGIGRASVELFSRKGWNVAATLRSPEKETELGKLANVLLVELDVTKQATIDSALKAASDRFGVLDVIVNNAGYGLVGAFEGVSAEQIERQFQTNVFGLMAVTRSVLPLLRRQKAGTIINVASMGGRLTVPLYSVYHASKWAVEGFSESLHYELAPLGIKVRLIEPGAIKTDFYARSADSAQKPLPAEYAAFVETALANMNDTGNQGASPEIVAQTIFKAANATSARMRYPVGADAKGLLMLRRLIPESWFFRLVRSVVLRPRKQRHARKQSAASKLA